MKLNNGSIVVKNCRVEVALIISKLPDAAGAQEGSGKEEAPKNRVA